MNPSSFSQTLPNNSKKLKLAFLTMFTVMVLCVIAVILSVIYWDQYTTEMFSVKRGRNVTVGWPATFFSWGLWLGIGLVVFLPLLYFMQDWKNPSLAISTDGLFINQQMIRNTTVPFSNIREVRKKDDGYSIHFNDNSLVLAKAGMFKPMVKYNLENGGLNISNTHSTGDFEAFFNALESQLTKQ